MNQTLERHKGVAFALLFAALVLLALATAGLEGNVLQLSPPAAGSRVENTVAVNQYETLFEHGPFASLLGGGRQGDVFTTTYFNKPAPPPPRVEAPKTRVVALTYLGTISGSQGQPAAFVRVDDSVVRFAVGDKVVDDWGINQFDSAALVVTNAAGTNQLGFRQSLKLEVPIR